MPATSAKPNKEDVTEDLAGRVRFGRYTLFSENSGCTGVKLARNIQISTSQPLMLDYHDMIHAYGQIIIRKKERIRVSGLCSRSARTVRFPGEVLLAYFPRFRTEGIIRCAAF